MLSCPDVCFSLLRLLFAVATGVLFAGSAGPTVLTLSGSGLGVSVLVAGYSPQSTVYWSELTSENACQVGTAIYEQWSGPYGMCLPCRDSLSDNCFQVPPDAAFKIIMVFLTIALAIIVIVLQLLDLFTCGLAVVCCRPLQALSSILLMASAALTFPFWTTTGLQAQLVSSRGSVVPVVGPNGVLEPSQTVVMGVDNGYALMAAGLCCAVLTVLTLLLPSGSTQPPPPPPQEETAPPPPQEEHVPVVVVEPKEEEDSKGCCGCRKKPVIVQPPPAPEDAAEAQSPPEVVLAHTDEMRKTHENDVAFVPVTTIGQV